MKSPWIAIVARSTTCLATLWLCSCAGPQMQAGPAQRGRVPAGDFPVAGPGPRGPMPAAGNRGSNPAAAGVVRMNAAPAIQPVSHTAPPQAAVRQMSGGRPGLPAGAVLADPRACLEECLPLESRQAICNTDCSAAEGAEELARRYPDEYLFDGGDRDLPVHYDAANMQGLETEDTVAEYRDDAGKRRVKPTNRVAIYAPRFGAVTTMSSPSEGFVVGRLAGTEVAQRGVGLRNQQSTTQHVQNDSTERLEVRVRGSELGAGLGQADMEQLTAALEHFRQQGTFEQSNSQLTGQYQQTLEAQLAASIHSAITWTREQNPIVSAHSEAVGEVHAKFTLNELVGLEEPVRRKGDLQIVKLADKAIAAQGDIVTFTIHYENLGDLELNEVAIIDNLTPRLEYVEDSADSQHLATFLTTDNGEGSLILRWNLEDPIPGHTSGVVKFKARVR